MTDNDNEIRRLFELWNRAIQTGVEEVVRLYASNGVLVPTLSNDIRTNHEEIRKYFVGFLPKRPSAQFVGQPVIRFYGDTAINSGIYEFHFAATGQRAQARYTFAYYRQNGEWLISEHHSSLLYREIVEGKAALEPDF